MAKANSRLLYVLIGLSRCIFGNNTRVDNGAYAAYLAAPGDLVWLLPPHLSYAAGASLSAAMFTVGLAIYSASAWPLQPPSFGSGPSREAAGPEIEAAKAKVGRYVLVYGASTVSGALALQMLRLSNISTIAICSRKNFEIATERGADAAFDYHDPSCADDIRRHTGGSLAYALDCITDLASMKICYAALGSAGGRYTALNPFPLRGHTRRDVRPDYVLCYTIFGKPIFLPRPFGRPARPKDRAFAEAWCESTQKLVDAPGVLLPHPVSQHSGLAEISAGLDYVRQGKVSATKLVYEVSNM